MINFKSNEFVWFYIFVAFSFAISYTNGINSNYTQMFSKLGENVTLKCGKINNLKNSNLLWKMNHKELPGRAKVMENGDLFISSFDASDAGIYICYLASANNDVGHVPLTEFELKPISVPGPLMDVNVRPYTVLMLITWRAIENDGGSPLKNITIRYRVDDEILTNDWITLQVDPLKVQKDIYYLHPNSIYKIQIWACNEIGNGPKTELTTKTLSDMTEAELEKHLLEGIERFDTRAWTFAVVVIMSTFSIFAIALCCLFIKDPRVQKSLEDCDDVERIELIPNITINPGYCEA